MGTAGMLNQLIPHDLNTEAGPETGYALRHILNLVVL